MHGRRIMDLNYLLHRHQISLMRADAAQCTEARHSHLGLARAYARRITSLRVELGVAPVPLVAG